jgi:hypothetical protein
MEKNQLKKFIIQDLDKVYSDLRTYYGTEDVTPEFFKILELIDEAQNKIEELN